jgi:hypothetical protein
MFINGIIYIYPLIKPYFTMKKTLLYLSVTICLMFSCSCASVFGGRIDSCQKRKPNGGEPVRQVRTVALIFDCVAGLVSFQAPLIIDFATNAIYKPCPVEKVKQ